MDMIVKALRRASQERADEQPDGQAQTDQKNRLGRALEQNRDESFLPDLLPTRDFEVAVEDSLSRAGSGDLGFGKQFTRRQAPRSSRLEMNRVLTAFREQHFQDVYNMLRTGIVEKCRPQGWKTIMITSAVPGEGKTLSSLNLGLSLAQDPRLTALVVDTHLRNPKLQAYFDLQTAQGLTDYLLDGVPVSDLLINPGIERFVLFPAGRGVENTTDLLNSPRMHNLVLELRERYENRIVLFDCPHILDMPDAMILSSYVDAIVLVVQSGRTRKKDIQRALEQLKDRNVLGLLLNRVKYLPSS